MKTKEVFHNNQMTREDERTASDALSASWLFIALPQQYSHTYVPPPDGLINLEKFVHTLFDFDATERF